MEELTCWTLVRDAGAGDSSARALFAERYEPVVRAYLGSRWRGERWNEVLDDVVQEAFLECFKEGGVIARADPSQPGGFRAFLYGAVRRVAQRAESGRGAGREERLATGAGHDVAADDESLSRAFDRAWARSILARAASKQAEIARDAGAEARRRCELLRLRFQEGLPIREIAERWRVDAAQLHHAYATAREEFKAALRIVVHEHWPASPAESTWEVEHLLDLVQ